MPLLTRRRCLQNLLLGTAVPALATTSHAALGPAAEEEKTIASLAHAFMLKHQVPGLSVAFAHRGALAYARGFGLADPSSGEQVTPSHRFRIASVSKPVTSIAIYRLIEQGKLKLTDKVFGGLLSFDLHKAASSTVADITVHQLLTHTCGGWDNHKNDPMFQELRLDHLALIQRTLETHALKNEPGKVFAYSNFGYCLLGRVIEKLAGKAYSEFVQENVLTPCGIKTMQIAGNTLADRASNEVVYVGNEKEDPYKHNVRRMDAHGGWLATPSDLVTLFTHVDGFPGTPDLLKDSTLKTMTTATAASAGYASGFMVNATPNWWHGGSLPGTSTLAVRTAGGLCWAGFTNHRTKGIGLALDLLMWQIAKGVPAWRA